MIPAQTHPGTILVRTNHRTEPWWRAVAEGMNFERYVTVSDLYGDGDHNLRKDFYAAYREFYRARATESDLLTNAAVDDVIARCRVLRWLPRRKAAAMTLAMARACEIALDAIKPVAIVGFPIDSYTTDVLERVASARGVPYYELAAAALPEMGMLFYRGRLIQRAALADPEEVERRIHEIVDPLFTPSYIDGPAIYSQARFLKTHLYFRLRGWAFKLISWALNDPLNQHFLDAQGFLGHKAQLSDRRITRMIDHDWRDKLAAFPPSRRIFIGLQVFPEASIDYWIDDLGLIDHETTLTAVAKAFSDAGYLVLVKDHPEQFGFRQVALLDKLKALANVVIVPHEVSGNEMVDLCEVNFTCTGALGMQAALLGKKSIVTAYYYTTPGDYIILASPSEIPDLPQRVAETPLLANEALAERRRRIISYLMRGLLPGNYMSFQTFGRDGVTPGVTQLGVNFGEDVARLGPDGEDWHGLNPWPVALEHAR